MPGLKRLMLWLLLCGIARPLFAGEPPSRLHLSYDVLKGGIKIATTEENYSRIQNSYQLESVSKATGLLALFKPETIRITSEGILTAKGLRPTTFSNQRKLDTERNARASFNWKSSQITLTDNAGERTQPLPPGTQDRLSAMYQFMFLPVQSGPSRLDFFMTNGSKVDIYNYLISPASNVTIPAGTFKAKYVTSTPQANESRTEIWLATEQANIPIKMVITDPDGDKLTQVLIRFDSEP